MQSDKLRIRLADQNGGAVVHVAGEVNWRTSPEFRSTLLDLLEKRRRARVEVDLQQVRRIDSSGVSSLVEAWRAAHRRGARFVLSGLNEAPRRVLRLTGLDEVFEIRGA